MKVPKARKLPSGTWFIQLRLDGESISVTGRTEKEVTRQATLIKAEHLSGKLEKKAEGAEMTLRQVCEKHIERKERAGRSPSTIRGYDIIARCSFQGVMDRPLSKIKDWQRVYDDEANRVSPKTMDNAWTFIRAACKVEAKYNVPDVETVAKTRNEHAFLDPEQIKAFIVAVHGTKYEIPLLLALHSCRKSEIMAIDWENVDLKHDRIRIKGAVVQDRHNNRVEKSENKTKSSTRFIPLFVPELKQALVDVEDKTGKVVTMHPNSLLRGANNICDAAGLPRCGVHGLRHSFASLCYSLDVPLKITMEIGGWDNPRTVSDIYTHLSQKDIGKHIGTLRDFFKNANRNANES